MWELDKEGDHVYGGNYFFIGCCHRSEANERKVYGRLKSDIRLVKIS